MIKIIIPVLGLMFLVSVPASSQVRVEAVSWESSSPLGKTWTPFSPVAELKLAAGQRMKDKLRAVFTVRNMSRTAVEGLVLRYALRLRLVKEGEPAKVGIWSVPFRVEELRLAKSGPGQSLLVRATRFELKEQIKKLVGTGFWFDAVKLEVMVEPRRGAELAGITQETVLPVTRP